MRRNYRHDTILLMWISLLLFSETSAFSRLEQRRYKRGWMPGTKPPGTRCTFNPCETENLNICDGGRGCEMDESCKHKCVCTDESYHESCVTTSTSTGKPDVTSLMTPQITTTSTKCIFNPCSVDNFCGDGRKCELDKTCKHKCACLDNFTHENCRAVTLSSDSSTTQSVLCAFNPCSNPNFNFCGEGRRCLFDKETCKHSCECLDDFTHDSCRPEAPTTTEPPDDEDTGRNCPPGFPCKHGYCQQPGYTCVCDEGWSGVFCDKDESAKCTRKCEEGAKCVILPNYTEVCVKSQPALTTTGSYDVDSSNVCSRYYKLRNESERTCKFGMRCFYGVCTDLEGGGSRCECDPGASGTLCLDKCCRDCGENGECFLVGGEEKCNCHYNYTGPECKSLKPTVGPPEEVTWYWWVVGVCAFVLVLLVVLLLVVPYIMWRKRVIIVMKIVHYFQNYEDDDKRNWDAFISYSERDYKFVVHTLYPKLELEQGFKLIMHHRDFLPGESISNNIINAVRNSRRTILIITPNFIKSEYAKFEYQVAQQEMLKRKHRIIPVLLDDISECKPTMDPTLNTILSSITYLECPSDKNDEKNMDKFWKRLQLSLPKKRPNSSSDTKKSSPSSGSLSPGSPSDTVAADDIKMSVEPIKYSFTNGITYSNKAYYSEPEADYDTINESELDERTDFIENRTERNKEPQSEEEGYAKIVT